MLAAGRRERDPFGISDGFGPSGVGFRMVWSSGPLIIIIISRGESVGLLWASVVRSSGLGLSVPQIAHTRMSTAQYFYILESGSTNPGLEGAGRFEKEDPTILKPQPYIGPEPYIP